MGRSALLLAPRYEESLQLRLHQLVDRNRPEVRQTGTGSAGDGLPLGTAEDGGGEEVSLRTPVQQGLQQRKKIVFIKTCNFITFNMINLKKFFIHTFSIMN